MQVPDMDVNYHTDLVKGPLRDDIKPLNITQPEVRLALQPSIC
jgi:hypothetical protein